MDCKNPADMTSFKGCADLDDPDGAACLDLLSIVVPCYNEADVIGETVRRLQDFAASRHDIRTELIFVDDGSSDATREILREEAAHDPAIKLIGFTRNFGHQIAVTAGIDAANGDAIVLIDADLQDPPEIIHEMITLWRQGYDVIYATRQERVGEPLFRRLSSASFYRLLHFLSDTPIPLDTGDFRLMSARVVRALRAMPEQHRFVRGMVSWAGYRQVALPYVRAVRFAGESKYSLRKLCRLGSDGILSFSNKPLKLSLVVGLPITAAACVGATYGFACSFVTGHWSFGGGGLLLAILFLGGTNLICLGILGEYIARIHQEVKGRPLYLVEESVGVGGSQKARSSQVEPLLARLRQASLKRPNPAGFAPMRADREMASLE